MIYFILYQASPNCNAPPKKKEASKDCGSSAVEGAGGATADDFEWDFWDVSCLIQLIRERIVETH